MVPARGTKQLGNRVVVEEAPVPHLLVRKRRRRVRVGLEAVAAGVVYKKEDVLKEKVGGREWQVVNVHANGQELTMTARKRKSNGNISKVFETSKVENTSCFITCPQFVVLFGGPTSTVVASFPLPFFLHLWGVLFDVLLT